MIALMPLDKLLSHPDRPVPRTKSLFSRFSNPISKRSRNTFDLAISPDDPFKTYSPGEIVKGQIVLTVLKDFDITHLVIALHGYAKVYKHQCGPGEGTPATELLVNGKGTRGLEYHGNGLISLFQEEQTLCGSGFLGKRIYKFGFELHFPSQSLPSTIDFERGTIAYMISATLTRPTTISPATTRYKKVSFQDRIDIESLYTPKSRAITLEPITRRGKVKKVKQASSLNTQDASVRGTLSRHNTQASDFSRSTIPLNDPPRSPAPSEDTVATNTTASTQSFNIIDHELLNRKPSPNTSDTRSSTTSSSAHIITATTEISRHGALRGDVVPIRVSVAHTKPARGVVIATLYRQGRIDMHPPIPLATRGKDKKAEYEDVYPRSRTGLGGLHFANASPSSVFRKDLSQSSTMMIVDPRTLTADVRTSIKVPDDAFPTITNVPGGMIAFTYHVEVVIDLTGKLGESRFLPSLTSNGPTFTSAADNRNQLTSEWANNILDTSQLRRTKSVATFELPLIIGTKDTRRQKQAADPEPIQEPYDYSHFEVDGAVGHEHYHPDTYPADGYDYDDGGYAYQGYQGHYYYDEYGYPVENGWHHHQPEYGVAPGHPIPPPDAEEQVDEKTRLRRQEELLMPSQPPESGEPSNSVRALVPSAPTLDEQPIEERLANAFTPSLPIIISRASARSADTIVPDPMTPPPSLPEEHYGRPTDDKQELERQRLLALASAPPTSDAGEGSSTASTAPVATAPVISEDEEYTSRTLSHEGHEQLPHYQR